MLWLIKFNLNLFDTNFKRIWPFIYNPRNTLRKSQNDDLFVTKFDVGIKIKSFWYLVRWLLCVPWKYLYASVWAATMMSGALWLRVQKIIDGVSLQGLFVDPGYGDISRDHHTLLRIGGQSEGHILSGIYRNNLSFRDSR